MQMRLLAVMTVFMLVLVACSDGGDESEPPPALPTQAQVQPQNQDEGSDDVDTDIPSITPFPTQIPQNTAPPPVRELPATFTPLPGPTDTPAPTVTEALAVEPVRTFQACDGFGVDYSTYEERFVVGQSPILTWTAVDNASAYRILITDSSGNRINEEYVTGTSYEVNPDVFPVEGRYSWVNEPVDSFNIQICPGRGEALLAVEG